MRVKVQDSQASYERFLKEWIYFVILLCMFSNDFISTL